MYILIWKTIKEEDKKDGFDKTWIRTAKTISGVIKIVKDMSGTDWKLKEIYDGKKLEKSNFVYPQINRE